MGEENHLSLTGTHLVQVWISSAWSKATLAAFRAALTAVLSSMPHSNDDPVQEFLRHWQLHNVPLKVRLFGSLSLCRQI